MWNSITKLEDFIVIEDKPILTRERVHSAYDSRFIKVFGLEYIDGKQYMDATRRGREDLVALKSKEDFKKMLPDAVSCIVVLDGQDPKLLLTYEFRYPTGQYLLSVPAGLIDAAEKEMENPLFSTAIRELKEETNIEISGDDKIEVVNPLLFSSPGMTDESNAIVSVVISENTMLELNQDGAEGTECFDGFEMLTVDEAKRILRQGKDDNGIFYSVYTWIALMWFVSGMWK